jgi:hypothetical protein
MGIRALGGRVKHKLIPQSTSEKMLAQRYNLHEQCTLFSPDSAFHNNSKMFWDLRQNGKQFHVLVSCSGPFWQIKMAAMEVDGMFQNKYTGMDRASHIPAYMQWNRNIHHELL